MSAFSLRRSRTKLFVGFAVAASLLVSLAVSPAAAGTTPSASWTDTCDGHADAFSSIDRLAESSTARGDVAREPALNLTSTEVAPQKGRGARFRATVPTYVHIVHHADGTGNVSDKAVSDQIQVL